MLSKKIKLILISGLVLLTNTAFAAELGYIKHQFINHTPNECYINVHQQYSYPIDACLGTVAAGETKTCDGTFEPHQPNYYFYAVCNGVTQHLENDKMIFLKSTYKSQNIEVIWTIDVVKKKLHVSYKEHGF